MSAPRYASGMDNVDLKTVDLNLLVALDALLAEGSVTGAARRLNLSASAMSRTLKRLRATTGDPLLVRAGRHLVPTPHAVALRDRVHALARDARAVLRPPVATLKLAALERTFTLRANEAFVEFFAVPLLAAVADAAPRVRLRFIAKPDKQAQPLREGVIDLEIGVPDNPAPELRTQCLFHDRYLGLAREGHSLLNHAVTAERFAACGHVAASPGGDTTHPIDEALGARGLKRDLRVVVPGFPDAMRIARHSDLVALVPRSCLGNALAGDHAAGLGLRAFEPPVTLPEFEIAALWHPRLDADPAHRWLRDLVLRLSRAAYPPS